MQKRRARRQRWSGAVPRAPLIHSALTQQTSRQLHTVWRRCGETTQVKEEQTRVRSGHNKSVPTAHKQCFLFQSLSNLSQQNEMDVVLAKKTSAIWKMTHTIIPKQRENELIGPRCSPSEFCIRSCSISVQKQRQILLSKAPPQRRKVNAASSRYRDPLPHEEIMFLATPRDGKERLFSCQLYCTRS